MSYSFNLVASTKAAARSAVEVAADNVAVSQPIHNLDRDAIVSNAHHAIELLADDDTRDVAVHCNGYLQVHEGQVQTACINVSASLISRK